MAQSTELMGDIMKDDDHNYLGLRDYEMRRAKDAPRGAVLAAMMVFLVVVAATWFAAAVLL